MRVLLLILFAVSVVFSGMRTDTIAAKGDVLVVKDTTTFLKPIKGDVKTSGSIGLNCGLTNTWHSNYSFIDLRGYGVVYGSPNGTGYAGGSYGQVGIQQNTRFNGSSYAVGNGAASRMICGSGKILLGCADSAGAGETQTFTDVGIISKGGFKVAGACTTSTTVTDSIKINGGSYLTAYLDTTFYDSVYDGDTYRARALCRIIQVGKHISLYQDDMQGTISSSTLTLIKGIPSKFTPFATVSNSCRIINNSVSENGILHFSAGSFKIVTIGLSTLDAGTGGIGNCMAQWLID